MIEKSVCDRGFVWNPINSECEGHKLCDNGGYLDYGNWKCRKTLAEECTENVEEIELAEITLKMAKNENKHPEHCVIFDNVYN